MAELATTRGKQYATERLFQRRRQNENRKKVDNGSLHAGSPMHYYCKSCNGEMILPEAHTCAVPTLCDECKALKELGWLE